MLCVSPYLRHSVSCSKCFVIAEPIPVVFLVDVLCCLVGAFLDIVFQFLEHTGRTAGRLCGSFIFMAF